MSETTVQATERRSGREKKESARIKEAKDDDWVNKLIRFDGRTRAPRPSTSEISGPMASAGSNSTSPIADAGEQRRSRTQTYVKPEPPHLDLSQAYITSASYQQAIADANSPLQRSRPLPVPPRPASTPTSAEYEHQGPHSINSPSHSITRSSGDRRRSTPRKGDMDASFTASPRMKRSSPGSLDSTSTSTSNTMITASHLSMSGLGIAGRNSPLTSNFDPSSFTDSNGTVTSSSIPEVVPCQVDCLWDDPSTEDSATWLGESSLFVPMYCQHLLPASSIQRSFFPAVSVSGFEYQLFDNVVLRPVNDGMIEGVARIIALFQEEDRKRLFVEWYYRKVDIVAHLNQVKAAEECSKNSWNVDNVEGGEDEISGGAANGFFGTPHSGSPSSAITPRRAARRGRPPKKRRCNIEESLQALQLAPDHEIWTAPRPFLSIISVSSLQSSAFVEHLTHLQPPPSQIIDPPSSPSAPPRFVYRKAYDHKTCHLSYCKPRGTSQPPQLAASFSSPQNSARLSSSTTSIPSASSSPITSNSIPVTVRGSQSHRSSTVVSSVSSGHVSRASRASKTDSFDSPRVWMDDFDAAASPASPKVRKTKEVDQHTVHRHHFMLSQSADSTYRHPVEHMDITSNGGGSAASTGEIPSVFAPMHYQQPAAYHGPYIPMHHTQQSAFTSQNVDYLMTENKPIPEDFGSSQYQAQSLPQQRAPIWGNPSRDGEIAYLRSRVDQMTEAFSSMQQTLTDLRDSVSVLQRQSQIAAGIPPLGLPALHQQQSPHQHLQQPRQPQQSPVPVQSFNPQHTHQMMLDHQLSQGPQGLHVPVSHHSTTPAPHAPAAHHQPLQIHHPHEFGVSAPPSSFVHMEGDSFVSTRELKEESYESPMDDFSCSSETVPATARTSLNTPSSKFISDRPMVHDHPVFNAPAAVPPTVNPGDLNFDHFFIEHVGAQ